MPTKDELKMYKMVHKKAQGELKQILNQIINKLKKGRTNFTYYELYIAKKVKQSITQRIQHDHS